MCLIVFNNKNNNNVNGKNVGLNENKENKDNEMRYDEWENDINMTVDELDGLLSDVRRQATNFGDFMHKLQPLGLDSVKTATRIEKIRANMEKKENAPCAEEHGLFFCNCCKLVK